MQRKVIYVPLDERNCNYGYPYDLGRLAGLDIVRPPQEIMSKIKVPCDCDKMWEWLEDNIKDCSYALLSLDMLIYGSLMNSRHHKMTDEECQKRAERIKRLKQINPEVEIHAFILIMRTANYNSSSEEPDYWSDYGTMIWKYSWLSDKKLRAGLEADEEKELADLSRAIPDKYLSDYTGRRRKNLGTHMKVLELVRDKYIDHLVIPKDDNAEFCFSSQDQDAITARIKEYGIQRRVYIYPGADEVGCTLVSRVVNKVRGCRPAIFVYYSATLGGNIVAKYEDRPINESVKWQVISAGAVMADTPDNADIILMVNTPGSSMIECFEQNQGDHTYRNYRNLEEFVQRLRHYAENGKKCIVADIAYSNGADNELMMLLKDEGVLSSIFGYGGWNTAANTLGVVILQGIIASGAGIGSLSESHGLFEFYVEKLIEDWAYQGNVMTEIVLYGIENGFDWNDFGRYEETARIEILARLNEFIKTNLTPVLPVKSINVRDILFPWKRGFDIKLLIDYRWDEET